MYDLKIYFNIFLTFELYVSNILLNYYAVITKHKIIYYSAANVEDSCLWGLLYKCVGF